MSFHFLLNLSVATAAARVELPVEELQELIDRYPPRLIYD
jgi:hypothetical protein